MKKWFVPTLLMGILLSVSCIQALPPTNTPTIMKTPRSTPSCVDVFDIRLASFPFRAGKDEIYSWIQARYGLTVPDIVSTLSVDGTESVLTWSQLADRSYDVLIWNDAREPANVTVRWSERAPTIADILHCLGDPPLYHAYHFMYAEAIWTYLELWYPEQGILVTTFVTRNTSYMTMDQAISDITYFSPGLPQDVISYRYGDEQYRRISNRIKQWPGDLAKITFYEFFPGR